MDSTDPLSVRSTKFTNLPDDESGGPGGGLRVIADPCDAFKHAPAPIDRCGDPAQLPSRPANHRYLWIGERRATVRRLALLRRSRRSGCGSTRSLTAQRQFTITVSARQFGESGGGEPRPMSPINFVRFALGLESRSSLWRQSVIPLGLAWQVRPCKSYLPCMPILSIFSSCAIRPPCPVRPIRRI